MNASTRARRARTRKKKARRARARFAELRIRKAHELESAFARIESALGTISEGV